MPFIVVAASLLCVGCLASPRLTTVVHEDSRTRVLLATVDDRAPRASHPAGIDPDELRVLLSGLYLSKVVDPLSAVFRDPVVVRAFTDEDTRLLAPLLHQALNRATPEEEVVFAVLSGADPDRSVTEGSLSVRDRTFAVTLTRFRAPAAGPPPLSSPSRSFARPDTWRLLFHPGTARAAQRADAAASTLPATVTILREGLPAVTDAPPVPEPRPPDSVEEDLRRLRDTLERQEERLKRLERQRRAP